MHCLKIQSLSFEKDLTIGMFNHNSVLKNYKIPLSHKCFVFARYIPNI